MADRAPLTNASSASNALTADIAAGNAAIIRRAGAALELDDGPVLLDAIAGIGAARSGSADK